MGSVRRGFTLVELLIAVVVVGLLAAMTIPRLGASKDRAFRATMKSDLRSLSTSQASHFYDTAVYTADLDLLETRGFQRSNGVSVTINEATLSGWSATVSHLGSLRRCYLFVGNAASVGSAVEEGVITCS